MKGPTFTSLPDSTQHVFTLRKYSVTFIITIQVKFDHTARRRKQYYPDVIIEHVSKLSSRQFHLVGDVFSDTSRTSR